MTPLATQESLLVFLKGSYGISGIEPRLIVYEENFLTSMQSLCLPLPSDLYSYATNVQSHIV